MPNLLRSTLFLGVAAGCAAALALPAPAAAAPAPFAEPELVSLRAQGPAGLEPLLARWDRLSPGPERDQLARAIDAVAGQRYATVSRLYWYTDLAQAQRAARAQGRPILALRMLGRLDEDLSCANSRLFRATLYANAEVGKLLRDHFVLYWSSERPVPKVTIDFGDGRKLERTTTGNSAHYVLDENGLVLDVLPGLYAPIAFRTELEKSVRLAERVQKTRPDRRAAEVVAFHRRELAATTKQLETYRGMPFFRGRGRLLARHEAGPSVVAQAQRATISKMRIEAPELAQIGIDAGTLTDSDIEQWAVIGQRAWNLMATLDTQQPAQRPGQPRPVVPPRVLDDRSRALIARLHNGGPQRATADELAAMIERLEYSIVADTALDQFDLRPQIRRAIIESRHADWASLNEWIYAEVFHTPREDAWLGLLPRTTFTGLPGDGVVMR